MNKPKPSKNGTVDLTVTIELEITASYYTDTDNSREFYPIDIDVYDTHRRPLPQWLADEILDQCEDEIEEACCDAIDDDVQDKLITRYETARDR